MTLDQAAFISGERFRRKGVDNEFYIAGAKVMEFYKNGLFENNYRVCEIAKYYFEIGVVVLGKLFLLRFDYSDFELI